MAGSPRDGAVVGVTLWQSKKARTTSRTREPISRRPRPAPLDCCAGHVAWDEVDGTEEPEMPVGAAVEKPCLTYSTTPSIASAHGTNFSFMSKLTSN